MSDELDEIRAIFFEECAEGLATAEEGLSAMQAGDAGAEIIAGVFRAVHSIKGGAGAFGLNEMMAFAHRFENLLDEVRGGKIAASSGVVRVLLAAFDVLSDHVAAAQGTAERPEDATALAALEQVLADGGADDDGAAPMDAPATPAPPASEEEDPFGFQPVGVALEDLDAVFDAARGDAQSAAPEVSAQTPVESPAQTASDNGMPGEWIVRFRPSRAALANAAEPLFVVRELEALGGEVIAVDLSTLPGLRDLDPENGYFAWTLRLPASVEEVDIAECFDFVAPDSEIAWSREDADAPPAATAPAQTGKGTQDTASGAGQNTAAEQPASAVGSVAAADSVASAPVLATAEPAHPAPHPATDAKPAEKHSEPAAQSIRVDLSKLDLLLNLVGELVIRNSILSDRLSPADQQRVELPDLNRLTRQIQDNVMSLRAQPIRQAFSRVPRMLRDLAVGTGKNVRLETAGDTTEVDKGVIEKIGDPLTHLIRNAVDHGIESAEERIAAGKPPEGTIRLSAEQRGARILVRVSDDGRGINREKVRAKAVEKGIVAADQVLSNEEIDQLICAPGFSTADMISNISGRGVGMDVVRSNVESLGGRVEILSVPGEGTSFTMTLPLTLAILDGMIVRVAGQRFVLPLANVIETIQPEPGQVKRTSPTNEVVDLRGDYLPVKRATELFGLNDDRAIEDSLVVIVESETAGHVGLVVDTIDDRREVVIKSLDQNLHPIRGLGGATILGDGSIALILDIEAMVASPMPSPRFSLKGLAA